MSLEKLKNNRRMKKLFAKLDKAHGCGILGMGMGLGGIENG